MAGVPASVRLVVLTHDGGDRLERSVAALLALDWPADELEVVVVDNASADGAADRVRERHPEVRVLRNPTNEGFPGNNAALRDLDDVRYVGLVNDDAFVEPGWLTPLVGALDADAALGAVNGTLVFEPRFVDLVVEGEVRAPTWRDHRRLGVCISGLRVDGQDRWRSALMAEGGWGPEPGADGQVLEWTKGWSRLRVPVPTGSEVVAGSWAASILLSSPVRSVVHLDGGTGSVDVEVGPAPRWHEVEVAGTPFDVVNNAGNDVRPDGYGVDRGFGHRWDEWAASPSGAPAEPFAWCGGAVLLRPSYLRDVGLFEPGYFLYYEDVDLSWRGRARGWRYGYVPEARARHLHSASAGTASAVATRYTERNRLLTLVRNAPADVAARAAARYVTATASYARRGAATTTRWRLSALGGTVALLPAALSARHDLRARQVVGDAELRAGMVAGSPS
jgi:GT2 family glycosyltransferase